MAELIEDTDKVVEGRVLKVHSLADSEEGYPFGFDEEQVIKLIYFFGSRKASAKALDGTSTGTKAFTSQEKIALERIFAWMGFKPENPLQYKASYSAVCARFKVMLSFLKERPAFVTTEIYKACEECGYKNAIKGIVMAVDKEGNVKPKIIPASTPERAVPLAKAEMMLWDLQNTTLDKLKLLAESISPADIKKANLGMKSKAMRDLFSVLHMLKLQTKNPNMTLINLQVNTATGQDKLSAYSSYISKNRESSNAN